MTALTLVLLCSPGIEWSNDLDAARATKKPVVLYFTFDT